MKLSEYLLERRITAYAFADEAGIPRNTLWRLVTGQSEPRLETIDAIEAASLAKPSPSGGVVTMDEIRAEVREARAARRRVGEKTA